MATINGTDGDDFLNGTDGDDLILAFAGNDTILGNGGTDVILGDAGDDAAFLNVSTEGADRMELGGGADRVTITAAGAGQVRLTFRSAQVGDGSTQEGTAPDTLAVRVQGEDGADNPTGSLSRTDDEGITFVAGEGLSFDVRDLDTGARRGDAFGAATLGTAGNDVLSAQLAGRRYYVNGGAGDDLLVGGALADVLVGGAGRDIFNVSGGDDTVLGGAGLGGDGFDTVNYGQAVGRGDGALNRDGAGLATGFTFADGAGTTSWSGIERVVFVDGAVDHFTDSQAVGVAHLYRALLGREADPLGLSFQLDTIEQSGDLRTVADALAGSAEGQAARAGLSNGAVVQASYAAILGRGADADGLAFWTGELDAGRATAAGLAMSLIAAPEFDAGATGVAARGVAYTTYDAVLITMAYRTLLGRNPEAEGLIYYDEGIDGGRLPLTGLTELFTRSPEFTAGDGTLSDAAFVDRLYERVLGRDGDAAGVAYYEGELRAGVSRGVVTEHFLVSPEAGAQRAAIAASGVDLF